MEGIIKEKNEEKKVFVIAGEDEKDYEIPVEDDFQTGDIIEFKLKDGCIDCATIKKTAHINLQVFDAFQANPCMGCTKNCGHRG
ncbi:MAG: hypothetical protein GXO64_02350 [Candidatus Micrarchaeota archaeon]|nr:hypothetical protein [Candidatus Micrarchaeota archaeon]